MSNSVKTWTAAYQAPLFSTGSQSLLRSVSIESVMLFNHPRLPPSSFALNLSQHQGLSNESALLIKWPESWSFSFNIRPPVKIQDWFPLGLTGLSSLKSKGLSGVSYSITRKKHQFLSAQPTLWSSSHICTWLLEKSQLWLDEPLLARLEGLMLKLKLQYFGHPFEELTHQKRP